jgi:DNA-nicking Smr family endonuclease
MRRPRHVSPEERALWDSVARQADPLKKAARQNPPAKPKPTRPLEGSSVPADVAPMPRFRVGQAVDHRRTNDLLPSLAEQMGGLPVQMDAKSFGKMKKGKLRPEARIDLHGMTLSEAHPELTAFILGAQAVGYRLVLVITGKGRMRDDLAPMPARDGILRHQVPQWLSLSPLREAVLQVAPAHQSHGGAGAYYVYLRRSR